MKSLLIVVVLAGCAANATTLPRLQVETLLQNADVVALVDIEAAELIKAHGRGCGATYRARIKEAIKGGFHRDEEISFGYYTGKGVGNSCLVFLTRKDREFSPKTSTNSIAATADAEFEQRCKAVWPAFREMHGGFGTLDVVQTSKFEYKDAVLFKEEWVVPPSGAVKKTWAPGDAEIVSERSWVRVEDVLSYLRQKAKSKGR